MNLQTREIITNSKDLEDLLQHENAALCHLAFWGHPAWMGSVDNTLSTTAVTQLVMYHRMRIALHKLTVAQIIGGVRGVIPDSKLAKYGDYRYDTDFEDMYCNTEDIDKGRLFVKKKSKSDCSQKSLYFPKPLDSETTQDLSPADHDEKESDPIVKKAISEWLNKIKNVLEGARRIASDARRLDYWTEELIKICLRFIYVARINDSLLKTMNSQITFITDYEQLQKEPVSRIELLSLPQPSLYGDCTQELKTMDTLWMKLTSPQVHGLWPNEDTMLPFRVEESFDNQQSSLIKVNFLRRCRKKKDLDFPSERIDISKDVAVKLLGSLLQVIDETPKESSTISSVPGTEHRSYFPQAHGDWTKQLFPRRINSDPPSAAILTATVKRAAVQSSVRKIPTYDLPSIGDHIVPPEGLTMPMRFYMCVPPPPLASAVRIQAIRQQQYVQHQIRNSMVKMSSNHPMPQQVQGNVPGAPVVCFPPPGYVQTPVPLNSWNYACPQRVNAPIQVTAQYPKINTGIIYQQSHSKDVTEILKHQPKTDGIDFSSDNIIPRRNEDVLGPRWEKSIYENGEIKTPVDHIAWATNKPSPQTNCESKVPFRVLQNLTRNCKILQPAVYEKCKQQAATNVYGIKSKSPLHIQESGKAVASSNGLKVIRLPSLGIQHTFPLRNPAIAHFTHKPRFMGGITINDLRLAQEKMFYRRDKYAGIEEIQKGISIDNFSLNRKENFATSADRVEKWLETVNFFMKSGSCISSKELSGSTQLEISSESDKLDRNCNIDDHTESVEWPNNGYNMVKMPVKVPNSTSEKIYSNNSKAFSKCKKKYVRKLLLKHLHVSESSLKLKKGRDLEGKVKLLKRYFAEMNLKGIKFCLKHNIRNLKFENPHPGNKRVDTPKKRAKSAHIDKCFFVFGTKHDDQPLRSENYFENFRSFSTDKINEFKVLSRESNGFNAFPSKRMKMCSSMSLFLDKELRTYNELKGKISSINYFDMITDDLFFSQKNPTEELSENHPANSGVINGWTHFKIVIKTILENILATFDSRNTNTSFN